MLEFNHDYLPRDIKAWGEAIADYLRGGDPRSLPPGVTYFRMRHHSDPCPLGDPPRGWSNDE